MCSRLDLSKESNNGNIDFVNDFDYWWDSNGGRPYHSAPGSFQGFNVEWLKEVGGYDEFYIGWGSFDDDIKERAIRSGLVPIWIDNFGVRLMHVYHNQRDYEFKTDFDRNYKHLEEKLK